MDAASRGQSFDVLVLALGLAALEATTTSSSSPVDAPLRARWLEQVRARLPWWTRAKVWVRLLLEDHSEPS